jgi:hypothetical protein
MLDVPADKRLVDETPRRIGLRDVGLSQALHVLTLRQALNA